MCIRDSPKTTALLFSSGKVVCTGAKSRLLAILACYKYAQCLRKYAGINARVYGPCVQNIVSTVNLRMNLDLDKFFSLNQMKCNYDRNLFPGAIWREDICSRSVVVLVFQSGRMVITGAKREQETRDVYAKILPLVTACSVAAPATAAASNPHIIDLINDLVRDSI